MDLKHVIDDNYHIYQIVVPEGESIDQIVHENYWELDGKVFSYGDVLLYSSKEEMLSLLLNNKEYELIEHKLEATNNG